MANFSGSGRFFLTFHPAAVVCVWDLEREGAPPALLRVYGASGQDRAESGAPEGLSPPGNHTAGVVNVPADFTLRLRSINLKTAARQIWLDASARFVIVQGGMAQAQVWEASSGLPITPMVQSRFSLDEEACKQVRLPSAGLSAADAAELAQLLSGSRLDSKGGSATLKLDELLVAWERLRQKYPSLFQSTVDSLAWHRLEAEAAQAGRDWSAAAFHWQWLRTAQPANPQFVQRHEYALRCLAKATSAQNCAERRSVIPPRDPQAGPDLIDLTDYYTGPVTEGVQLGVQSLADVPFDVRGMVTLFGWHAELHGIHGRELVPGIRINRRGQRLHFLHTARWGYAAGAQPLAVVLVKYANGQVETINIRYQWEVGNDWFYGTTATIRAQLACVGASPLCSSGDHCECLFKYTWPNPHPDWEISQLDLLSTKTAGSYVLVALTVE